MTDANGEVTDGTPDGTADGGTAEDDADVPAGPEGGPDGEPVGGPDGEPVGDPEEDWDAEGGADAPDALGDVVTVGIAGSEYTFPGVTIRVISSPNSVEFSEPW